MGLFATCLCLRERLLGYIFVLTNVLFIRNSFFYVENDPGVDLVINKSGTKVYLKYCLFRAGLESNKGNKTCVISC
jgi:hypothetical protein